MNWDQIQQAFQQPYQREPWLVTLRGILPSVEIFTTPQPVINTGAQARSIHQLGRVSLAGGRRLALLEVVVDGNIDLLRNRVSLRNLVAGFIDQAEYHGVFAVFLSHKSEYRFTFAARESAFDGDGRPVKQETAPRRFTYVLGPGEPCRTAAERFAKLAGKGVEVGLTDIVDAFSVEKLNKEFFTQYKLHYEKFVEHILGGDIPGAVFGVPCKIADSKTRDLALKPVRDFVKKLLGRLVFLNFLQKKGWMGCPAGRSEWTGGKPDFIQNLFNSHGDKERFHSQCLAPLFYEALNRADRPGDVFPPTGTRVPYLNGGLFEHEPVPVELIDFPAELFSGLIEFLAAYNFTIDENDPEDHEVGIDPEMLGHIFENLLEDNKDKGAYYTPKAIVQYMCQQSLMGYLATHLGEHPELEALVRHKEIGDADDKQNWVRRNAKDIERLLDDVKICDPAIGSGAFPIGLLQEIYWIKLSLDWTLDRAEAKRRIIQHSIYGVDLDAGAVEIARLRFWLALIVEEDQPHPLPNLDYKIMQGDSLLESFEGVDLSRITSKTKRSMKILGSEQFELGIKAASTELTVEFESGKQAEVAALIADYFNQTDPNEKRRVHALIDKLVLGHIEFNLNLHEDALKIEIQRWKTELKTRQRDAKNYKPSKKEAKRISDLEAQLREVHRKHDALAELQGKPERPFFLWHLFFQDVFTRNGFDIVIANPPYVSSERFSGTSLPVAWKAVYDTYAPRVDIYCLFYELGLKHLLRDNGTLCFISSNKYLRAGYGEKLRELISKSYSIRTLLDFGELPVFAAGTDPSIILVENAPPTLDAAFNTAIIKTKNEFDDLFASIRSRGSKLIQGDLSAKGWTLESHVSLSLLTKLRSCGIALGNVAKRRFYRGVLTGLNEAFIIDQLKRDALIAEDSKSRELIQPWLQGREIKRWKGEPSGLYLIKIESSENKTHPWSGKDDREAEKLFAKFYPAVHAHMRGFRDGLKARDDQGKYYWELRSCAYWGEFSKPKIVFNETAKELHAFVDRDGLYVNKTGFILLPDDLEYVLAVLNSNTLDWLYRMEFPSWGDPWKGGRVQFRGDRMAKVPIPDADEATRVQLRDLAFRATKAAGKELALIEAEINQIVYRLFALTPEEIALIEAATAVIKPTLDHKSSLFTRVIPELAETPYFSMAAVKQRLGELQIDIKDGSLRQYMSEAMAEGLVHDAGRGWYSRLETVCQLDQKPVIKLVRQLEKEFPLLDFTCWSTQQVNPWMHHILSKFVTFVNVDRDGLVAVGEFLRGAGYEVHINPTGKRASEVRPNGKTVVVSPLNAYAPRIDHFAPPEAVLVDLYVAAKLLGIMGMDDFQDMAKALMTSARIGMGALLYYAEKRELQPGVFVFENYSLIAEM
jgi:hypothetical protein